MLGCQDFCGYYDWTFSFLRREFGDAAVRDLWANAIGLDSQKHYIELGKQSGLRGLYDAWKHTGEDEQCDWTFTLDESSKVLRWDMRKCPSKGFLLDNDLNADEDYCDHCIGWESAMLGTLGLEMIRHEHNHSGQCWGEMTVKGTTPPELKLDVDIRYDPRWNNGYIERFGDHVRLPVLGTPSSPTDWVAVLTAALAGPQLVVLGRGPSVLEFTPPTAPSSNAPDPRLLVTGSAYAAGEQWWKSPDLILINSPPDNPLIQAIADRYATAAPKPLLTYAYLPSVPPVPFPSFGLPRPIPILPALIRAGLYTHNPKGPYPTTGVFLTLLAAAVTNATEIHLAGIDSYAHPSGKTYAHAPQPPDPTAPIWPPEHSPDVDHAALTAATNALGNRLINHSRR